MEATPPLFFILLTYGTKNNSTSLRIKNYEIERAGLLDIQIAQVVLNRTAIHAIVAILRKEEKMSLEKFICLTAKLLYTLEKQDYVSEIDNVHS